MRNRLIDIGDEDDRDTCDNELTNFYRLEEFQDADLHGLNTWCSKESITTYGSSLEKVKEVQIIGHSLGEVDEPYFKCLAENLPCNIQIVFWAYEKDATATQETEEFQRLFARHYREVNSYK